MVRKTMKSMALTSAVAGCFALTGCIGTEVGNPPQTSTQMLSGNVPAEANLEEPEVTAVDESGASHRVDPDDDGDFALELPTGHTYKLYVSERGTRGLERANQIVFPRADGRVDGAVRVRGAMAPFDLGEVRPAGTLETAEYYVHSASTDEPAEEESGEGFDFTEVADGADADDDAGATDDNAGDAYNDDDIDRMECADGPAGLFCVHDGMHPGCDGLSIAAEMRGPARDHVAEPAQTRPIALPQFNPPFEFPGCGASHVPD